MLLDMRTVRGGDTPTIVEKTYLPNQWGCPKVVQEIVCEDINFAEIFKGIGLGKVTHGKD